MPTKKYYGKNDGVSTSSMVLKQGHSMSYLLIITKDKAMALQNRNLVETTFAKWSKLTSPELGQTDITSLRQAKYLFESIPSIT